MLELKARAYALAFRINYKTIFLERIL